MCCDCLSRLQRRHDLSGDTWSVVRIGSCRDERGARKRAGETVAEKPGLSDRFPRVSRGVLFKQTLHNMYIMIYNLVIPLSFTYLFIEKHWLAFNEPPSTGLQVLGHSTPTPPPRPESSPLLFYQRICPSQ